MSTAYMNLTLPTVGPLGTQGPDWANEINTALDLIDAHDHSTNKGKRITPAGININQTLEMNSNQLSEIASLALDNLTSQPTASSLIYEYGGEMYFNDGSGNQVKLTSGGSINVASLGTITGDYSTSGADVKYVDAASSYIFSTPALTYAEIDCGPLKIFGTGGYYAQLQQSVAQAGNLDWTLPALYPAATLPMKVSSGGVLSTDQIQTSEIADASVTAIKLASDSVETAKIVNLSVTTAKINDEAVTTDKIAYQAVTNAKILTGAVGSSQIATGAIIDSHVSSVAEIQRRKLKTSSYSAIITGTTSSTSYATLHTGSFTPNSEIIGVAAKITSGSGPALISLEGSTTLNTQSITFKLTLGSKIHWVAASGFIYPGFIWYFPANILNTIDTSTPGSSHVIKLEWKVSSGLLTATISNLQIVVYEL